MVDLQDVRVAQERIKHGVVHTPCVVSEFLSQEVGATIYLKLENLQSSGSFKFRGAYNYLLRLSQVESPRGVVTASNGNHGVAVALAAAQLGVGATVVMPLFAPLAKKEKAARYGAMVMLEGDNYEDAVLVAQELASQRGLAYVPNFEDPRIVAGYATMGLELLADIPDLELVIAPVGGGGLLSGLLVGIKQLNPRVKVVGVEAEGAGSMQASLKEGRLVRVPAARTIADGIAVRQPGLLNFEIVNRLGDGVVTVSDEAIIRAMRDMALQGGLVMEPAAAAAVAGLRALADRPGGLRVRTAAVVVTGGNAGPSVVARIICGQEGGDARS